MRRRDLVLVLAVILSASSCGSDGEVPGSAQCASSIRYDGQYYFGSAAQVTPADLGARLGTAVIPACNDTGGSADRDEEVVAVQIKGVPPSVAVAVTYSDDVIFTREEEPGKTLPEHVLRLLRARPPASPIGSADGE